MKWSSWQGKATSSASKGRSLLMVAAGALLAGVVSAGLAVAVVVAMLAGGGADSGADSGGLLVRRERESA